MSWLDRLTRRRRMERDLAEEIDSHIEERTIELLESGIPERDARSQARREFGNATRMAEEGRAVWAWTWLEQLTQDLRYSFRTLCRAPAFTAVAILSLAFGIGGNTAVFSLLDGVMLKNLPVPNPQQLRILTWPRDKGVPMDNHSGYTIPHPVTGQLVSGSFSYPAYLTFRDHVPEFEGLVAFAARQFTVTANSLTDYGSGEYVTGNYFQVIGARPLIGRTIAPSDDAVSQPPVAVLTYRYWSRRFQLNPAVLGSQIVINWRPVTVIGIMPPSFQGLGAGHERDFFLPLAQLDADATPYWSRTRADTWWVQVFGRLRPGTSEAAAASTLTGLLGQSIDSYAGEAGVKKPRVLLSPGARGVGASRGNFATPFYILGGTVCLVLLIACMNLANLLLARAAARQREIAIRLSIGASRWRLIRQLFTESVLLSALGGLAGLLLSPPLTQFLLRSQGSGEALAFDVRTDVRTLAFTFGVSLLAGVAFGIAPAWRATRVGSGGALRAGGSAVTHSRARLRFHWLLISAQVAFSLILLVTAGLFARTLAGLASVDLGFQTRNILTFRTDASRGGYKGPALANIYDRLRSQLETIPGVESVALSQEGLITNSESDGTVYFPDRPQQSPQPHTLEMDCSDSFLSTVRIPILRGRDLAHSDGAGAPMVAVIDESFRQQYFPNEDPLGKIFYRSALPLRPDAKPIEIVGVARNAHYYSVRESPAPTIYLDYRQGSMYLSSVVFAIRSPLPQAALAPSVRRAAAAIDPTIPIVDVRTEEDQIRTTLGSERLFASLVTMFGVLATLLAAIGLYGVLAYAVSRRTAEIGIRIALGASRSNVLWQMIRGSLLTVLVGLAAGIPAALALTKITRSLLFGVEPGDLATLVAACTILLAVSAAAAWLPARHAARIQPTQALRYE